MKENKNMKIKIQAKRKWFQHILCLDPNHLTFSPSHGSKILSGGVAYYTLSIMRKEELEGNKKATHFTILNDFSVCG